MHQYSKLFRPILARWVYEVRMEHHFTQEDMAEQLRMSPRCYSDLESGKSGISFRTMVSFMYLLKESEWIPIIRELTEAFDRAENEPEFMPPENRKCDKRGW